MMTSTEEIKRLAEIELVSVKFESKGDSVFGLWKDVRKTDFQGDCQSYMFTVGKIWFGGTWGFWKAVLKRKAVLWRGDSPKNKWYWPRHAVLHVKRIGYIDSNQREWRDTPAPNKLRYPIGLPIAVVIGIITFNTWYCL